MRVLIHSLVAAVMLSAFSDPAPAQAQRYDAGIRLSLAAADGEPANDIPGAGVVAHYAIDDRWTIAAAIDRSRYDFEEPAKIVGIIQDPSIGPVDALAEATTVSLWIERSLSESTRPMSVFVGAGLGAAFTDIPNASGPRADGGRFDIRTEAATELLATILGGVRFRFDARWYGEFALHVDRHFADWRATDRITGAQGSIDDYSTWGAYVAAGLRW